MSWRRVGVNRPSNAGEKCLFRRKNPQAKFAAAIYTRVAEQARAAELFEGCGIPDTLDGRFDSLALHADDRPPAP